MRLITTFVVLLTAVMASGQSRTLQIEMVEPEKMTVVLGCRPGFSAAAGECKDSSVVRVRFRISGEGAASAKLKKVVTGGRILGDGPGEFRWDFSGLSPGVYTTTLMAEGPDGKTGDTKTFTVTVRECEHCRRGDSCPVVELKRPAGSIDPGGSFVVEAKVTGAAGRPTFNWTVSAGTIESGQGTPIITVGAAGVPGGSSITTTLEVRVPGGFDLCPTSFSETVLVNQSPQPVLGDEFGTVKITCEEANARMDVFLISLNGNPRDRGVIVIYDSTERTRAAWFREQLFNNFIKFRRFDPSRIRFIRGPYRSDARVQFWRVPPGASEPEILPANVQAPPAPPERNPAKPYLFATEYSDGLPECQVPMYDLVAYARVLNTEPRSRGRIIIGESSPLKFARKQREMIAELSANGVTRKRLTFIYKYVRPSRLLETTELWVVPQSGR